MFEWHHSSRVLLKSNLETTGAVARRKCDFWGTRATTLHRGCSSCRA